MQTSRAFIAVAAFLLWTIASGCRKEVQARENEGPFGVLAVASGTGPLGRNEPLVLRFSKPVSPRHLPERAIVVLDDKGHSLPIRISAEGRHLFVTHREHGLDVDWPESAWVEVRVPYPVAGPGFRSRDDEENARSLVARVELLKGRLSRPGSLQLVSSFPGPGDRGISFDPKLETQSDIVLDFNAPLDPASLEAGIQVVDLARGEVLEGVSKKINPLTPSRVLVSPFAKGLLFNGGTLFEVHLTSNLRSRDGWTLVKDQVIDFETAPGGQRLLHFGFGHIAEFDERSRPAFSPDGLLRPRPLRQANNLSGNGRELAPIVDNRQAPHPHVFSSLDWPSRSQILIPAAWLSPPGSQDDDRAGRFLITSIDFRTDEPFPIETYVDDLIVTLGYLSQRCLGGGGLEWRFDVNDDGGRRTRVMPLAQGPGPYRLAPEDPAGVPMSRVVRLEFAEPFLYDNTEGDLVLGIHNSGVRSEFRALSGRGLAILGFQDGQDFGGETRPFTILMASPGEDRGLIRSRFLPFMSVHTLQFPPVISRWHAVDDVSRPCFNRTPGSHVKAYGAREGIDFTVSYQSGDPVLDAAGNLVLRPDGSPDCDERGGWDAFPPRDGGRAIRIKIDFEPRLVEADDKLPEIEYLLVGYREL